MVLADADRSRRRPGRPARLRPTTSRMTWACGTALPRVVARDVAERVEAEFECGRCVLVHDDPPGSFGNMLACASNSNRAGTVGIPERSKTSDETGPCDRPTTLRSFYPLRVRIRSFVASVTLAGAVVAGAAITPVLLPSGSVAAAATASSYVAMPVSQRLLDTRLAAPLGAGASVSVNVTGSTPLPAPGSVVAAVLNVTVTGPAGAGYWTVWPHSSARPEASNLNIDELQSLAGGAVPNLVTVPVGADGIVDVYTSTGGNVIVDLLGYYTPADTATAGRFQALAAPTRVMDTRNIAPFKPGEARNFTVPGAAGASGSRSTSPPSPATPAIGRPTRRARRHRRRRISTRPPASSPSPPTRPSSPSMGTVASRSSPRPAATCSSTSSGPTPERQRRPTRSASSCR